MLALQTDTPFVYELFRIGYCLRRNCIHQTNISFTNGVPSAKHIWSYGRADRLSCIFLLFHTLWYSLNKWGNMQMEIYSKLGFVGHFMGSILMESILMGSILMGSIHMGSILMGSILMGSILMESILMGSILMGSILMGSILMGFILMGFILTKYASFTFLHFTVQVWNIKGWLYVQRYGIGKLEFECSLKGSAHCSVPFKRTVYEYFQTTLSAKMALPDY